MTTITAALVMQLRERTGAGMMECKKFLVAAEGDIEKAIDDMRKAGQAKADKKADRIAAEGGIFISKSTDCSTAVILEVNCETDFVAHDENFKSFGNKTVDVALTTGEIDVIRLSQQALSDGTETIEIARQQLVAKIGENIQLRRLEKVQAEAVVGTYLHGARIGVVVGLKKGDEQLARDLAMHIAANKPLVIRKEDVPASAIQKEREIALAQASTSGKPQDIIDKMVDGRINKFVDEVCLLGQSFVKDPTIKIEKLLKDKQAEISSFVRYEVGEGIEKKQDDFVAEVMAQVRD